jgi:hypothetical protein
MTHFQRTSGQGDMFISTLAMLLPFPDMRMSLGFVSEDWGHQKVDL